MPQDTTSIALKVMRQQHMRWSREGLDPILQIRAAIANDDWRKNWKTIVASI